MKNVFIILGVLCLPLISLSQQGSGSGQVVDEKTGTPLSHTTVSVKGGASKVFTDDQGLFRLSTSVKLPAILQISYVGYNRKELAYNGQFVVISLSPSDSSSLNDVVVVGYSKQKRQNLTGAVDVLKMDEVLGSRPETDLGHLLQGEAGGLQVNFTSGEPGAQADLNIRGATSINGGAPLVVLDNVPISSLSLINPADIESVTVLKDAGSAAIYGARSAFGVLLLTSKKGNRNQKPRLEYTTSMVFNRPADLPKKANPTELIQAYGDVGFSSFWTGQDVPTWSGLLKDYAKNPAAYPGGHYYDSANSIDYPLAETDAFKDMTSNYGFQQNHNLAVSGGTDKLTYRFSTGFTDEDGILVTNKDRYKRNNISAFISSDINSWLTAQASVMYNNSTTSYPYSTIDASGFFSIAASAPSYMPLGYSTVDGIEYPDYSPRHAIEQAAPVTTNLDETRATGRVILTPLKDLKITGEYTFDRTNDIYTLYDKPFNYANGDGTITPSVPHSNYLKSNSFTNYNAVNIFAEYSKTLGDHSFTVLGGYNNENAYFEGLQSTRQDNINVNLPSISLGTGVLTSNDTSSAYAIQGYFYRLNYAYKGKYLLETTGRYDGSSKFPDNNRWGFFPSVSAGWRISQESFMQGLKPVLSEFKIRGSYGSVGNQSIAPYQYTPSMSAIYSNWIDNSGLLLTLSPPAAVSNSFTWEKVINKDLGVDFGFFSNHLTGSFDLYERLTEGMLAQGAQLPAVFGTPAPLQNVADLKTNGWELAANWHNKAGQVFYHIGFNLADSRAEITKYNNTTYLLNDYYVGQRLGSIWGLQTQGLFTTKDFVPGTLAPDQTGGTINTGIVQYMGESANPGDVRFKDLNGDGVISVGDNTLTNPGDQKIIGNNTPRYIYGINGGANWKGFDFSFFIQGVGKRDVWMLNNLTTPFYHAPYSTFYKNELDFWRPESPDADNHFGRVYTIQAGNARFNQQPQTRYLLNGAYWRIKNITLGYTIPEQLLSKIKIHQLRFFASVENLYTHKDFPAGLDPNFVSKGVPDGSDPSDYGGQYPIMIQYSFGLNLTF